MNERPELPQQPAGDAWRHVPPAPALPQHAPPEIRRSLLSQALGREIAYGARIESQTDFEAYLVRGRRPNHLLHFIVGLVTCGLWWIVWIVIAATGGEKRFRVRIDEFGRTLVEGL